MGKKYIIKGKSMCPFLKDGNIVEPIETDMLELGDIVVFTTPDNRKVFHRVVLLNKRQIKCKGDNCLHFDWLRYNFGTAYNVVRHKHKKIVAKVSNFWGKLYYKIYINNPSKYQENNFIVKCICFLQKLTISVIFIINKLS